MIAGDAMRRRIPWLCRLGIHRWRVVRQTHPVVAYATVYWSCTRCGLRRADRSAAGHQPLDVDWIAGRDREADA